MENWKNVVGYEGLYEVSDQGNVRNSVTGRVLKPKHDRWGYLRVNLYKDRRQKSHLIHRLVARAFIQNPENYPQVNHKDEDKENNAVENIEWCTAYYNTHYGTAMQRSLEKMDLRTRAMHGGAKTAKPINQYCLSGSLVGVYRSSSHAAEVTGVSASRIRSCVCGKAKMAGGYVWRLADAAWPLDTVKIR